MKTIGGPIASPYQAEVITPVEETPVEVPEAPEEAPEIVEETPDEEKETTFAKAAPKNAFDYDKIVEMVDNYSSLKKEFEIQKESLSSAEEKYAREIAALKRGHEKEIAKIKDAIRSSLYE